MENESTKNFFYLALKHVHKYGCAKFQPDPLFSSQQTATKSVGEEQKKKKKKVSKPIGDPVGGRDAPIILTHCCATDSEVCTGNHYNGLSL